MNSSQPITEGLTYALEIGTVYLSNNSNGVMGKYQPLGAFLRAQATNEVPMTFAQIERVIGEKLPGSAMRHRAWWSNNPSNSVITWAWLEAGFRSEQVDMEGRKLVFRRVEGERPRSGSKEELTAGQHPLIGWMKGTLAVAPGVDLTKPAEPEWGEVAYGDRSWSGDR